MVRMQVDADGDAEVQEVQTSDGEDIKDVPGMKSQLELRERK